MCQGTDFCPAGEREWHRVYVEAHDAAMVPDSGDQDLARTRYERWSRAAGAKWATDEHVASWWGRAKADDAVRDCRGV